MLEDALEFLDRHINLEATAGEVEGLSLARMQRLAQLLGDPQTDYPVIQVTGTNGKGSTSAMITRLLTTMGLTVGTYGSPHVSSINERIQRNGEPITDAEFAEAVLLLEPVAAAMELEPSWFELMTAAAYRYFADVAADVVVAEVGKLGRFDATNIVEAHVAVVTNVGYDHTDGSDGWRGKIAWEKAGIISPSSILCLGVTDPDIAKIFLDEKPAKVLHRDQDFDAVDSFVAVGGQVTSLRTPESSFDEVFLSLHGDHQAENASLAVAAVEAFLDTALPEDVVTEAFAELVMPGRFEVLGHQPLVVIDGAHNPDGAAASVRTLNSSFTVPGRRWLVVGMMRERDPEAMLTALEAERAEVIICTTPPSPRGMPARDLAAVARQMGFEAEAVDDPGEAMRRAQGMANDEDLIFGVGSLYVAGAIRDQFDAE